MLYSLVGLVVIIIDQAVKFWVSDTLLGYDHVIFIPKILSLVNVHNDGCAFSFLSGGGARIYFIVVCGVFTLLVILGLVTNFISGPISRWSIVLVAAGGLGNCIDRVIYGYVQDMFMFEPFNFAVFNVADVFITVFSIVFVIAMLMEKTPEEDDEEDEAILPDEDEDEDDDYDVKPKRKGGLLATLKKEKSSEELAAPRAAKKSRTADYERDDRATEQDRSAQNRARRPATQTANARPTQQTDTPRPTQQTDARRPAPRAAAAEATDPFADWEQANARANARRSGNVSAAMSEDAPRYVPPANARPSRPAVQEPAKKATAYDEELFAPDQTPRRRSESPAQPKPAPQRREPAARAADDFDFTLDSFVPSEKKRPAQPTFDADYVSEQPVRAERPTPAPKKKPAASDDFSLDDILAEFK